jgi:hypothetical protein
VCGSRQTICRSSDIVLNMHQPAHVDPHLELDFIREFSVNGDLVKDLSADDRRERIRVLIYTKDLVHKPFRDSGLDYAQAYERCYGRPIEMRCIAVRRASRAGALAQAARIFSK